MIEQTETGFVVGRYQSIFHSYTTLIELYKKVGQHFDADVSDRNFYFFFTSTSCLQNNFKKILYPDNET